MYLDKGMRAFADKLEADYRKREKERRKRIAKIFLKILPVVLIIGLIIFVCIMAQ